MNAARFPFGATICLLAAAILAGATTAHADDWWKPYRPPCTERENVFAFTEKPTVKLVAKDRYEIAFAVKGACDVTVDIVDTSAAEGPPKVVRHLASGVLGSNAPEPFQKDSLAQKIYWNGKDDLDVYPREPEKLTVRVRLGLKPTFEKLLGGTSPHNMPGIVWAMGADKDGVYVLSKASHFGRCFMRVYDHDGNYVKSLLPPPANLPAEKLAGWGSVEYEPGKFAVQARYARATLNSNGEYLTYRALRPVDCQPAVSGGKFYFCDNGKIMKPMETSLHSIHTDGSSDLAGKAGRPLTWPIEPAGTPRPRLAASPDGKWIYMATGPGSKGGATLPLVFRARLDADGPAEPFLGGISGGKGHPRVEPGSDNRSFQTAAGIACDAAGRIYVADTGNNRIQVYDPDGKYRKTISVDRPHLVQIHRKTGAIYVTHEGRERGATVSRMTKFASFDNPKKEYHVNDFPSGMCVLDSWAPKPRFWTAGGYSGRKAENIPSVEIFEEDGGTCRRIMDFDETAAKADGAQYIGRWPGWAGKVICDVKRNTLYYASAGKNFPTPAVIDIDTGTHLGDLNLTAADDIAFDKKGYMHCHFNPTFFKPGVGRLDPDRVMKSGRSREGSSWRYVPGRPSLSYGEVPYDYGVQLGDGGPVARMAYAGTSHFGSVGGRGGGWSGILPVKDQGGAKAFQDGIGVNMRGDVAEQCNIYYVPKMGDETQRVAMEGSRGLTESGTYNEEQHVYTAFMKSIEDAQKKGESIYFIKRHPGVPLTGGTVWTFEFTGELRDDCAVIAGDLINGVQIDEDGDIYFVNARVRAMDDKGTPFLFHRGGVFGDPDAKLKWNGNPMTGTFIKTRGKNARVLTAGALVRMSELPNRPPDLVASDWPDDKNLTEGTSRAWVEGARFLYAGAGPIVFTGCSCPTMRFHTDWYKRSFVPETYRHSIGVLDANGNLVLHIGRYGNLDSAMGPKSAIPVGGDGIGIIFIRFIGGTDDRLIFDNHGEQIVSLSLDYHAQESVPIGGM